MRYFLEVAYHGGAYHGWQAQHNAIGVQTVLDKSLSLLLGHQTETTCSGRTDTGVHCRSQYVHFDTDKDLIIKDLLHRLNAFLPKDIVALSLHLVHPHVHARYDAISRSYQYHCSLVRNPFTNDLAYRLMQKPDFELLQKAAEVLLEYNDYEAFCKTNSDVNHYLCHIKASFWEKKDNELIFNVKANRFLRGMVRILVGTMLKVGYGDMTIAQMRQLIELKGANKAKLLAPAHGLYLCKVEYPEGIWLQE